MVSDLAVRMRLQVLHPALPKANGAITSAAFLLQITPGDLSTACARGLWDAQWAGEEGRSDDLQGPFLWERLDLGIEGAELVIERGWWNKAQRASVASPPIPGTPVSFLGALPHECKCAPVCKRLKQLFKIAQNINRGREHSLSSSSLSNGM